MGEHARRVAEYNRKKAEKVAKKGAAIAKSIVTLVVKPYEVLDDAGLQNLYEICLSVQMDGLKWAEKYEKCEVAFGIMKIRVTAVIEDTKVSVDDIQMKIENFEDDVQST